MAQYSLTSRIPSLSSSKSHPSGTKSPSLSAKSSNPGQTSAESGTPSPSASGGQAVESFSSVTAAVFACGLPVTVGIPSASTVSPRDLSESRSENVNVPPPSIASAQPSLSESVSNAFSKPSPS